MAELYPYPRFSLAERDRRWKAVRELMREHRLDVIVTPQNSGHSTDYQANSRYLTHVGGGGDADVAAVFPLEGEVTAIATSAAPRWPTVQDWTRDVREARRNYGRVIVERLKELNVERGRIGITGLGDARTFQLGFREESAADVDSPEHAHFGARRSDHQRDRGVLDRLPLARRAAGVCRSHRSRTRRADQSPKGSIQSRVRKSEAGSHSRRAGRTHAPDGTQRRAQNRSCRRGQSGSQHAWPRRGG